MTRGVCLIYPVASGGGRDHNHHLFALALCPCKKSLLVICMGFFMPVCVDTSGSIIVFDWKMKFEIYWHSYLSSSTCFRSCSKWHVVWQKNRAAEAVQVLWLTQALANSVIKFCTTKSQGLMMKFQCLLGLQEKSFKEKAEHECFFYYLSSYICNFYYVALQLWEVHW